MKPDRNPDEKSLKTARTVELCSHTQFATFRLERANFFETAQIFPQFSLGMHNYCINEFPSLVKWKNLCEIRTDHDRLSTYCTNVLTNCATHRKPVCNPFQQWSATTSWSLAKCSTFSCSAFHQVDFANNCCSLFGHHESGQPGVRAT